MIVFLTALAGESDPEKKRKAIGKVFIDVFDDASKDVEGAKWLAQGTIYPDVIESVSATGGPSATIKSHHNVGGLPDFMKLEVVEPLRLIFKDEVRRVGKELGIKQEILGRHPFPGPGLAIRISGRHHRREGSHLARSGCGMDRWVEGGESVRRGLAGRRNFVAGSKRRGHGG